MKNRLLRSGLLPMVALGSLALVGAGMGQPPAQPQEGQPPRRSPQPGQRGGEGGGAQTVEQCMKAMNRAARMLRDQIGDASKKDDNLKLIWTMQKNALQAKTLEPEHIAQADKAKLLPEYRKDQNDLLRLLLKLEDEVSAGKTDEAGKTFETIAATRDREHEKFKVKD